MLNRRVFLMVSGATLEAFESERAARSHAAEYFAGPCEIFEVTGVRECSERGYLEGLIAAKEKELADMRARFGLPPAEPRTAHKPVTDEDRFLAKPGI